MIFRVFNYWYKDWPLYTKNENSNLLRRSRSNNRQAKEEKKRTNEKKEKEKIPKTTVEEVNLTNRIN